jgi:hypothetical protein
MWSKQMKKLLLILASLWMAAPVMAADDAAREAQCETWAAEDGLKGQEAQEYIAYCIEEGRPDAPEEESPRVSE